MSLPAPTYNPAEPKGGNSLEVNVNTQYAGYEFNYTYLIFCGYIVWIIIPGIGFMYGGLARKKSALTMLFSSLLVVAVTTFQFLFWGYSLGFARTGHHGFIGDFSAFGMKNVLAAPSPASATIPEVVLFFYELVFAACTVQIVVGGAFERGRIIPSLVFGFFFATLIYCPVAYWTWNANGWLYKLPSLDFAGGGPVHITSGWAGLAYALVLGKRRTHGQPTHKEMHKPHNTTLVFLGTVLIWFGWFGFNGGSALNGSVRAMVAAVNTNTAASFGVLGWVLVDMIKHKGRFSVVGACEGAIAGLVGITPAAGYVGLWMAAVIGFITGFTLAWLDNINEWIGIDDGLYVWKLHGIGGIIGCFLTGIFADERISALDGVSLSPGGLNGVGAQVGRQFAEIGAISSWSFTVSVCLLLILKYIPGMHLRISDEAEAKGLDLDQFFDEQIGDWQGFGMAVEGQTPGLHSMGKDFEAGMSPKSE